MKIFCQHRKLNISPAYLLPGFAFGGSCLPKDLRALSYQAKVRRIWQLPILTSILPSNEMQISRGLQLIMKTGNARVGHFGIQFQSRNRRSARKAPSTSKSSNAPHRRKGYDLRI